MKSYKPIIIIGFILAIGIAFIYEKFKEINNDLILPYSISLIEPENSQTENDSIKGKTVKLKITKNLVYFIDDNEVENEKLEAALIELSKSEEDIKFTIVIQAENSVPVNKIVEVMEITNRNKFKVIFSENSN